MKMLKFPDLRQTYEWDCGANAIQSVLIYYGVQLPEHALMKQAKTTRGGTAIAGIKRIAKKHGLSFHAGKMTIDDIKNYIDKKIPVILLVQAWANDKGTDWKKDWKDGHYVVSIGYDSKKIYFEDPAEVTRTFLTYAELLERWHDVDTNGKKYINWGMAVFGKKSAYDPDTTIHMD